MDASVERSGTEASLVGAPEVSGRVRVRVRARQTRVATYAGSQSSPRRMRSTRWWLTPSVPAIPLDVSPAARMARASRAALRLNTTCPAPWLLLLVSFRTSCPAVSLR